jgi:hypothetical protein
MKYRRIGCALLITTLAAGQAPDTHKSSPQAPADQQEIQALTRDIVKMRTLLQQMEMNLAFVQTTQTPLKHQFELEIDMWRTVLDGMERRAERLRGTSTGGATLPDTVPLRQGSRQGRP